MRKEIIVTQSLADHLRSVDNLSTADYLRYRNKIFEGIEFYIAQFSDLLKQNATGLASAVHKAIDEFQETDKSPVKPLISCRKGCAHCCHINVDVYNNELPVIMEYVQENGIPVNIEYLQRQVSGPECLKSAVSACVFLKDNLCSIYPVRPIMCRKYRVVSPPLLCETSKIRDIKVYFDLNIEVMLSAYSSLVDSTPLPKLILEHYKLENDIQP